MRFLAVNTAGKGVEVVVYDNGKLTKACDNEFKRASVVLLPFIESVLAKSKLTLEDMDFFGVCIGAGSFTGIRIGVVTIRSLAAALKKDVVGVTYSDILAYTSLSDSEFDLIVTISDASNGYVYVAAFDNNRQNILGVQGILIGDLDEYLAKFDKDKKLMVVCEEGMQDLACGSVVFKASGDALARAVESRFIEHGACDYNKIEPIYVRTLQAERDLALKEQNKARETP